MKKADKRVKNGKLSNLIMGINKFLFSNPYISLSTLFILLFLFSPGVGLFQSLLQINTPRIACSSAPIVEISKGWEYRWGDIQAPDYGKLPGPNGLSPSTEWKPIAYPLNPPQRNGRNILFLRNSIPAGNWKEPALLIDGRGILLTFRAYVDGRLIFRFGNRNSPGEGNFSGISSHVIPLDKKLLGKMLTFSIFSDYSNIGIRGRVTLGDRSDLVQDIVKKDISRLVIGLLIVLIGLLDFFSYRDSIKTSGVIPMFGILSVALGLYTINVTTIKDLIFYAPVFWFNVYIVAMTLIPVGSIGFVWQTFRPQSGNFLHRLWLLHVGYAAVCQLFFLLTVYSLLPISVGALMLNALRWLLILEMILILGIVGRDAITKKDTKARIYLCGFIPIILAGVHDALAGLGKIDSSFSYVAWALMGFMLSLELIRRRGFINMQNRLKEYAGQLEIKSQEKEDLLRDLHDGIGGLVTNIKFLSEMGRNNLSIPGMKEALKNISALSSESLIEISNFMQSLDEDDTDWSILLAKFRQFGTKLLESRGLSFHLKADIDENIKKPGPILFLNLLQIYKEAITNATKHSRAKAVRVVLMINEQRLLLTIEDDGIGYGRNIVHGKGLANMKVRARKIGGILSITSAKGTLVMLGLQLSGQAPEKKPHK